MRTGPYLFLCVGHSIDHILMLLFMYRDRHHWDAHILGAVLRRTVGPVHTGHRDVRPGRAAGGMARRPLVGSRHDDGVLRWHRGYLPSSPVLPTARRCWASGLFLVGTFASIYHPVAIPLIVRGAGDRRGRLLGINGVFGSAGMAVTPVIRERPVGSSAAGGRYSSCRAWWRSLLGIVFHMLLPGEPAAAPRAAPGRIRYRATRTLGVSCRPGGPVPRIRAPRLPARHGDPRHHHRLRPG